jgi:hypothetical protein
MFQTLWFAQVFTRKKHNRMKDILIDYVFDHCNNEVVQRIEAPGLKIEYSTPRDLENLIPKSLIDQAKKSGNISAFYTTRGGEYCKVLVGNKFLSQSLAERVVSHGFREGNFLYKKIEAAYNELIVTSYFARNSPNKSQVKLTEKGRRHYLDGKSFEDEFATRRNSIIALAVSIASALVALTTLVKGNF